ncbi:MAG: acryloyl-CoA reductase [Deltaproteobacteria bacterium]|nr:acryloyl-CoA reductase [Deltaproteobacteria bacterium]
MKDTMQAYVLEGGADAVRGELKTLPTANLPAGEVTIRVQCSGINFKDAMISHGVGRMVRTFPHIPGVDLAGEVVQDTTGKFKPGSAVLVTGYDLGVAHWGGYAEFARVPAAWVVPLPRGLSAREAMTLGTAGFTAMLAIMALERNGLKPEQGPVLVTGATGGVGSIAVDILAGAGYTVAASSGKADMHGFLKTLGASEILSREAVVDATPKVMLKERWAGAVDNAGGKTLEYLLRTVKGWGSVALTGLVHHHEFSTTVYPFILRGVNLLGIDSVNCAMPLRLDAWARLAGRNRPAHLKEIGHVIDLAALPGKLKEILDGGARGRYVVRIAD